jgi:hypothetical protein
MGRIDTKGTKQLGSSVDAALLDEFRLWLEKRGEKLREHLEMALRRHMDNPPPPLKPAAPPLPPVSPPPAPAARKKGKSNIG